MSSLTHCLSPTPVCLSSSSSFPALSSLPTHQHQLHPLQKTPLHFSTTTTFSLKPTSELRSKESWVHSLRSQARSGLLLEAISTYISMLVAGILPDNFIFPAILKACADFEDLNFGAQIHAQVLKFGYGSKSTTVDNTLVNMYGKCGDVRDVYKVFDKMSERDQVSWNSIISALCKHDKLEDALEAFWLMQTDNVEPSSFSLVSVVSVCGNLSVVDGLRLGKQVHAYSLRKGYVATYTMNALMAMYAKLEKLDYAKSLLYNFEDRDLVSWNTIISSFSQNDRFTEALGFFKFMVNKGVKPDGVTIASILPACSHLELLDLGKEIHAYVMRNRDLSDNSFVASALADMYCNCKQVRSGRRVFDNTQVRKIAIWNAMLAGYALNGQFEKALMLFIEMLEVAGFIPNPTTMASVLPSCVHSQAFLDREGIHGFVIKLGFGRDIYVQNALMDMYSRTGKVEISKNIFDSMDHKDIVSWNTMITGCVICGHHTDALLLLHEMQTLNKKEHSEQGNQNDIRNPCRANSVTLMAILPGCASLSALAKGKEIHAYAMKNNMASDVAVGSALVDMYAKCGCLTLSKRVFDHMPKKNVITWNMLIMAYGMHGQGEEALGFFRKMTAEVSQGSEVKPNEVTFIALFAACSHSGLVNEGLNLFHSMRDDYKINPTSDHYACLVDLLGRAGKLEAANELINNIPAQYDKTGAWSSLLGACRLYKNVELGEIAARTLIQLEPHIDSHYVLLSNIYSSAGLWEKAMGIRNNMKQMGVKKEPGCSWIEFGEKVHKFLAGDTLHPQSEQLHGFIEDLSERMKKEGYVPDTSCVLHNIDEGEKESLLCGHSEKLAIAFGILNTPPGRTIRVSKNLRVCNDCHTAAKFISMIEKREIILRDVRRFHHFKDGICSCRDYW
ncbi:pentatricopeptide repeat-containing protein At3g57430, chloroplastic [Beta vulgaris subsp. vulgaris]|uniref:pentatricopeptide repeat-containing protein At3g57430, chloroplastic n=1 Tax=Beta vulgaris subsp. vulgaris TaxID=3555 RepID=UPI002036C274|nr:pentatricopeptide repeat-containing protein At3g57430, chloroplastic [Beta vulgaris subsp. vulgaris]